MQYDVVIVGGSFAGLAAALYLARAHKAVCVLDTALPRNRFATASHGFFAQDGSTPHDLLATMRRQIAAYPTVQFINEAAMQASGSAGDFHIELSGGSVVEGKRIVLAHGIVDMLPGIPGLAHRWGKTVLHCPYCHGFEVSGQRLGVLNLSPAALQQALLALEGVEDRLSAITLTSGRTRAIDALFISPRYRLSCELALQLGCELQDLPLGQAIAVNEARLTTTPGVYAGGDITRAMHNITFACADGVMAAMAIHRSLL